MENKYQKLTIHLENVNQAQAIALKKMFKYMEHLGDVGSSRMCSFYSDGDGDFRPKVSFEYPEELPDIPEITGILTPESIKEAQDNNRRILKHNVGDFAIDFDTIAWKLDY